MKPLMTPGAAAGAYAIAQKMGSSPFTLASKANEDGNSFADVLAATVGTTRELGRKSDVQAMRTATGQPTDLVEVVTAVAESEAALESLVTVRDRVVAAYEEIMRMPI